MNRFGVFLLACALAGFGAGCGDDSGGTDSGPPPPEDGGGTDAGGDDAGGDDAGGDDAGTDDAGTDDAGPMMGDFSLTLMGYDPHADGLIEVRVVRESDMMEVGRTSVAMATGSDVLSITGIIEDGVDYQVDWYADLSGNSMYDAPPTDHAWRLSGQTGTADGLAVSHTHNTEFTDIEWPAE